jgi:hypothetical protein
MDTVEYFKQTLNADIYEYGLTPLLFDQMIAFLREFVQIENDSLYKVLAVEMAFLLTKNRGFYKKTIRPIVLRVFGKKSFLYTNLAILKQIAPNTIEFRFKTDNNSIYNSGSSYRILQGGIYSTNLRRIICCRLSSCFNRNFVS